MKKLLNYILVFLFLLIALYLFDLCYMQYKVKPPNYKHTPTDTTNTKSITDETWFWLLLAS